MEPPLTTNVEVAARLLGFGRTYAYERVRQGSFPGLIALGGRRYRVSLYALAALLGCPLDELQSRVAHMADEAATDWVSA